MPHESKQQKACARFSAYSLGLSALLLVSSTAHAVWEEKYYNPQPLPDDVVLPMPCDGAMVFRKVQIPLAGPLDDYAITLGQDDNTWGYLEKAHAAHIAGSFTTSAPQPSRYYLLAKYELTALQYQSLVNDGQCPTPSNRLRLPQVSLSWFDAMSFSDRYNLWLRKNAADQLPKEDGAPGFVRLPTEVEWEFAARGGMAVAEADFRDLRFPNPDGGLGAYAWFAGSQSANGKLQLAGLLKPNPLGLHDILGNVDEMLFEPFRLNKLDRPHGQAGGYIVRGGNYRTPQAELRSALRQEQPYYSPEGEQRLQTTGVRLALVSPVLTSRERIKEVERSWQALGAVPPEQASGGSPINDIQTIVENVEDQTLKQQLEKLRDDLRANAQARDEQRDQSIRTELQLGVFLCTKLKDDGVFVDTLQGMYQRNCESGGETSATCPARKKQLDSLEKTLNFTVNYYASSLVASAMNYNPAQIEAQLSVVEQQMNSRGTTNLPPYLKNHWSTLKNYIKDGLVARSDWLQSCKVIEAS